jgi:hypothetical protein
MKAAKLGGGLRAACSGDSSSYATCTPSSRPQRPCHWSRQLRKYVQGAACHLLWTTRRQGVQHDPELQPVLKALALIPFVMPTLKQVTTGMCQGNNSHMADPLLAHPPGRLCS